MKKALVFLIIAALVASMSLSAFAASDKAKGSDENSLKVSTQKEFKEQLTEKKKEINRTKSEVETQKEALEAQYQMLIAAGQTEEAAAVMAQIEGLDAQLEELQAQKMELIQERYMVVKTMYTEEELLQFEDAAALIEQMYADACALDAGSIIVKNNIIKLDAPAYIKGSRTLIPVRAIEDLGAEVSWDEATKTVTVTKDNTVIVITLGDTTVYVDGVETQLDVPAELNSGRTYVPLRFLAEALGLDVEWDSESGVIDIDDDTADDETPDDATPDDATPDDATPDDETPDDGSES